MHTLTIEPTLLLAGLLVAAAIVATRLSARLGLPSLVLFLATGMLAGSDGPGGIWFDDPALAWSAGVAVLGLLLFSAGLDTHGDTIRPVLAPGLVLASVGVAVSTGLTALFTHQVYGFPLGEGLLLGAIVSSTDAAAVFGVLRTSGLRLKGRVQPLLELESGSNDPVAIFLTVTATAALAGIAPSVPAVVGGMALQLGVGLAAGVAGGRLLAWSVNRLQVPQEGLYPVFATAAALLVFGATAMAHGSGFLAVYVAGIVAGGRPLLHRRAILRFHDALAWLGQIAMFVLLGLLVFPSRLPAVAGEGLGIAAFLVLVARPVAVAISLTPFGVPAREQVMVAWVGLRGAVPIVLAAWPRVVGVPGADRIFDVVFFVVLVSVLVQGTTLPWLARRLGLAETEAARPDADITGEGRGARTLRGAVGTSLDGRTLVQLGLPTGALIAVIERDGEQIVPQGGTRLMAGDTVLVVHREGQEVVVRAALGLPTPPAPR